MNGNAAGSREEDNMSADDEMALEVRQEGHVARIRFERPPNNFLDAAFIAALADTLDRLGDDDAVRAVVLEAGGRHFCAGANLPKRMAEGDSGGTAFTGRTHMFRHASRVLRAPKPVVAAVQGAAIGAGLGLALLADFRVTCPAARFSANFNLQGFHPGFGLTCLVPRLVGPQAAALLLYTGRRVGGDEAVRLGLADMLVETPEEVGRAAAGLAAEIAVSAPLAVRATRETLRRGLADAFDVAAEREFMEQFWLRQTEDFTEGVKAMGARRTPDFRGR